MTRTWISRVLEHVLAIPSILQITLLFISSFYSWLPTVLLLSSSILFALARPNHTSCFTTFFGPALDDRACFSFANPTSKMGLSSSQNSGSDW